jgi:hypothetical protein
MSAAMALRHQCEDIGGTGGGSFGDNLFFGVLREEELMRTTLTGLAFAGALSLACYQSADAVPADAAAMKHAGNDVLMVQEVQFYARPTRHGVIKCYRQFVVGRPVCRHFYRWW